MLRRVIRGEYHIKELAKDSIMDAYLSNGFSSGRRCEEFATMALWEEAVMFATEIPAYWAFVANINPVCKL